MKKLTRWQALGAMVLLAFGMTGVAVADHKGGSATPTQVRLKTRLSGSAIQGVTPEGSAEFRADTAKGRMQLEVEVEHVNLAAGTTLDVSLTHAGATTTIGQIKLSALGGGELELNSQDGATVPAVQKGDVITVSNAGTAILAGAF